MRKGIKLFHGFVDTSYYLPDYLFSSLPLPPATRGKAHRAWRFALCTLRFAHTSPQKLLIIKTQMVTPTDLLKTNTRPKKSLILRVNSCNSWGSFYQCQPDQAYRCISSSHRHYRQCRENTTWMENRE